VVCDSWLAIKSELAGGRSKTKKDARGVRLY
jgi:hypothetical protein